MHVVGEKGLLKQLEAKGYKVEQPVLTAVPATVPAMMMKVMRVVESA